MTKFSIEGQVAVITGASSGIGRAIAKGFAEVGAHVVLLARRETELKELSSEIREIGGNAAYFVHDLLKTDDWNLLASKLSQPYGSPSILVNSAGVNLRESWPEITEESWDATLDLNLKTPFFLSRALVTSMIADGSGKILNIASLQSERAFAKSLPYGASKGGVTQLTRAMSEAWSAQGVMVNAIAPGFFRTELTQSVFENQEKLDELARQTAVGRNGELEDLLGASIFLCSPAADYITGQTLFVDGGFTAK